MLFRCPLLGSDRDRDRLAAKVCPNGEGRPCMTRKFVETQVNYRALVVFAREAIKKKRDYTHENELRRMMIG